jgi:hypothetical protein
VLSFWRVAPEIKGSVWVLDASLWVALLRVDKVRELDGILDEEDWSVVANHVVVAFLRVELYGESTRVTVAVIGTTFSSNSRKSQEKWSLLSNLVEESRLRESLKDKQNTQSYPVTSCVTSQ